jgi:hypothetical protein
MLVHLQKRFIKKFSDGKGITCFYSGLEVVPLTHAGFTMLSFHQGNPTLKSDDPGQTWLISAWFMNKFKGGMSPDIFRRHMKFLKENYISDTADAAYERYIEGEDVEVTRASILRVALSTFAKNSFDNMKSKEKSTKK